MKKLLIMMLMFTSITGIIMGKPQYTLETPYCNYPAGLSCDGKPYLYNMYMPIGPNNKPCEKQLICVTANNSHDAGIAGLEDAKNGKPQNMSIQLAQFQTDYNKGYAQYIKKHPKK